LAGLEVAADLGATDVEVRADSELMVRQLTGVYRVKNPGLQALYVEAVRRLQSFATYRIVHVPRERNRAADKAANDAVDRRASYLETGAD
jgi:ribonuclease HI